MWRVMQWTAQPHPVHQQLVTRTGTEPQLHHLCPFITHSLRIVHVL